MNGGFLEELEIRICWILILIFFIAAFVPLTSPVKAAGNDNFENLEWASWTSLWCDNKENNTPPSLSKASVTPSSGDVGTLFTYRVTYSDADCDEPAFVRVVIDGIQHNITKEEVRGFEPTSTHHFYFEKIMNLQDIGTHEYYFVASDGKDNVRFPKTGAFSGPTVTRYSISIFPKEEVRMGLGEERTFTARVSSGDVPIKWVTVDWKVSKGEIVPFWEGSLHGPSKNTTATYHAPENPGEVTITASYENVTAQKKISVRWKTTLTFVTPMGNRLIYMDIYYKIGDSGAWHCLGGTDSEGKLTTTENSLGRKKVYFKDMDDFYEGTQYIGAKGGEATVQLQRKFGRRVVTVPLVWLVSGAIIVVVAVALVLFLFWRRLSSGSRKI